MHPTLSRLDRLSDSLSGASGVIAVLGLGSAGVEHQRFDEHSDIDFFVVVDDAGAKSALLDDIAWLRGLGGVVATSFCNDPNGRKALFADGLFVEYAIFTLDELPRIPFTGERVVWQRAGTDLGLQGRPAPPGRTAIDTVDFHVTEALTNLYVGLHRDLRGERLTAMRFIQVYAVDRILALLRLDADRTWPFPDAFEGTRRVESAAVPEELPLARMASGYLANRDAATAVLAWLTARYPTDPVLVAAVEHLLAEPSATGARP